MSRSNLWTLAILFAMATAASGQENGEKMPKDVKDQGKKAVDRGLKFLVRTANANGSWNDPTGKPHPGVTALALTALLRSHRALDDTDLPVLRNGVDYLISMQKADGGIYDRELANYVTSISVMALAEAKKRFKDEERVARIDAAIEKAKKFIVDLQADEGEGYQPADKLYGGLGYGGDLRPDLSNTQLAMEALSEAGLPKDHPFYQKAMQFLQRCQNRSETNDQDWAGNDGGFVYYPGKSFAGEYDKPDGTKGLRSYGSMTYAGLKSYIYAGLAADDPRVKAAYDWITQNYTLEENPGMGAQGLFYYFHTFAKTFQVLGMAEVEDAQGEVHNWRADLVTKIVSLQEMDEGDAYGSWINESDRWWEGDRILATTYAVIALDHALE